MNWQDRKTWPVEPVDFVIGADLIYQTDMVPLLLQTIGGLLAQGGTFLYAAPDSGRQGQEDFFAALKETEDMELVAELQAPSVFSDNPLENQDDEDCFLHFNELKNPVGDYRLYEFRRSIQAGN